MNWTQQIDLYCERTDPGFWAEPLNAASNAAFLLAALYTFVIWRRDGGRDGASLYLICNVAVIGVGSFLFHTLASRWSMLADVLPITALIYAYFGIAMRRFFGLDWPVVVMTLFLFGAASWGGEVILRPLLGGSAGYAPALVAMAGVGTLLAFVSHAAARYLILATAVFALSLASRMADNPVCASLPIGTHYVWHVLNAVTLTILILAAIRCREKGQPC
ncbi:ceramidase domain-containing protein [Afifella sp. IM 167]|uniref:ceramidase domain-containing protein n=1 Tax=Afifella sp. IM 167 TaxID=2033586 RepID=UPI001CCF3638|nr:hypothetical protein [Afifella sp. IM 167]